MMRKKIFLVLLFYHSTFYGQNKNSFWTPSDTLNKKRRNPLIFSETLLATGSLLALNELWYSQYPKTKFHLKNDYEHWKQMDKLGHVMTSYHIGGLGMKLLAWSGLDNKNQLIFGATAGFAFLTAVEILDGFSDQWGFSIGDFLANAAGTGTLIGQELLWKEQRIKFKYSFHRTRYAAIEPEILGENFIEQSIKDYNGQTYWVSINIWSFTKESNFPKWLNVAVGYGANGMLHPINSRGGVSSENPYRQFYISLDIDLVKIKTKSKFLQSIFSVVNFVKFPSPALEILNKGKFKFHYLHF